MRCIVYRGREGLLLVPDCVRASMEAERDHGPLQRCGEIETDRLDPLLLHAIDDAIDRETFARGDASLALRGAYQPEAMLPLPDEFAWHLPDFWEDGAAAVVHEPTRVVVATLHADASAWTWTVVTNAHRPWVFRGTYVGPSQPVAMQYLAMWVADHARELRRSAHQVSAGSAAPSAPR